MARIRNRSARQQFCLYSSNTTLGWVVVNRISFLKGEEMVALGPWRRVHDTLGNHIGYQPCESGNREAVIKTLGTPTAAALTARESAANAGLMGCSLTVNLTEEQRLTRRYVKRDGTEKVAPPEDFIEKTREKLRLYHASVNAGGDRAVRVYPRRLAGKD